VNVAPLLLSIQVAALAIVIAAVLGVAIAALLARRLIPGADLVDGLVTAPMVLPPTVLGYYVLTLLGRHSVMGRAFESIFGASIVFTQTGAVVAATIGALPLVVLASRGALESVDPTLVRAARTLGASPFRAFLTVELPLAAGGILAGVMLGFARALGDFGVTLMIAGDIPGETQTASLAIYDAIQGDRENDALAMVFILTAFAVLVLYAARKLTKASRVF
jgi:molybdate transport system permease protein